MQKSNINYLNHIGLINFEALEEIMQDNTENFLCEQGILTTFS